MFRLLHLAPLQGMHADRSYVLIDCGTHRNAPLGQYSTRRNVHPRLHRLASIYRRTVFSEWNFRISGVEAGDCDISAIPGNARQ